MLNVGDNFSSTDHSFIGPSWIYSKQKSHFRSSYRQISKILQSQVESKQKFPIKIFIHNPFLFQAEILTRSSITKFRKLFYNSKPRSFYKISVYFLFQAETALKLILSPNFVVQNRVSKSQYRSLVHQNIYNPFLFQLHFNSQILSRNFENYSASPKSRVKVSTSPPLSLLLRTSKYSHTSYSKLHFNSSRPPLILGFYNNRGRSNMSRYTRVSGSNSLVSRYYATSDSIRTVTTSRRDCLNCDHLPAPIATILHAASARSHN